MPAITYEIGGKNTKLRQSLQDSKQAVRDFRQNLKAQTAGMRSRVSGRVGFLPPCWVEILSPRESGWLRVLQKTSQSESGT